MKNLRILLTAFTAVFVLQACQNHADKGAIANMSSNPHNVTAETRVDGSSGDFMKTAARGGLMEVELGKYAQQHAQSQRVKNFGAMIVRDHSEANSELRVLASKKRLNLPPAINAEQQANVNEMMKMTGSDFDKHYMEMMTQDHVKDVQLFQNATDEDRDADVKEFARKTLPILKMHLDSAKIISATLK